MLIILAFCPTAFQRGGGKINSKQIVKGGRPLVPILLRLLPRWTRLVCVFVCTSSCTCVHACLKDHPNALMCIWNMVQVSIHVCEGPVWLRWQTEQTAGLHTRHMSGARCYDTVAPTAPWIPGGQSGCKLETVCNGLIYATHTRTHTHTHTHRFSLWSVVSSPLYIFILLMEVWLF